MSIKVAVVGVGNCVSSLVQGVSFYTGRANSRTEDRIPGLIHTEIGGYGIADIEFVAAFDIDKRKIGRDLAQAIFAKPNCALVFSDVGPTGIIVQVGNVLDGVASHMTDVFDVTEEPPCDIVQVLKSSGADMLINYLPVGSAEASRYYAECCLEAGVSFINAIPEFICSTPEWSLRFEDAGLVCAGDDIKSQVGATILHRALVSLVDDRGQVIDDMYQLNVGGNTDFENMIDESRLKSKRISKTQAVTSILSPMNKNANVRIGPSDYVSHLGDNKVCYINIKGKQFGGVDFEIECKLSVQDSPNSAGVMVDVIRGVKLALDRKYRGELQWVSSYFFKSPAVQYPDSVARNILDSWISGYPID